jgi:hypothetical protein
VDSFMSIVLVFIKLQFFACAQRGCVLNVAFL